MDLPGQGTLNISLSTILPADTIKTKKLLYEALSFIGDIASHGGKVVVSLFSICFEVSRFRCKGVSPRTMPAIEGVLLAKEIKNKRQGKKKKSN